jgi:hypothetical protein
VTAGALPHSVSTLYAIPDTLMLSFIFFSQLHLVVGAFVGL